MKADEFIECVYKYQNIIPFTHNLRESKRRNATHFLIYKYTFELHVHRTCIFSALFFTQSTKQYET